MRRGGLAGAADPRAASPSAARRTSGASRFYRIRFAVAGATVTLAGIAMLVTPGPAFVVIPIGLAMLALEFAWAERLLDRALDQAEIAQRKAAANDARPQRILGVARAAARPARRPALAGLARVWDDPADPGLAAADERAPGGDALRRPSPRRRGV